MVILPTVWMIYKDTILTTPPAQISNWIQSVNVITSLFLSIASGFVITFLIQGEYEDKTIINVLSAPTSRSVFLFSKFLVWLLWYLQLLGISMFSLAFTGIELFSLMLPVKFASMIPWSAAMLFGYGMTGEYTISAILSIIVSGLIGVLGGWIVFQRQNQ